MFLASIMDKIQPKQDMNRPAPFRDRINEINKLKRLKKAEEKKVQPEVVKDIKFYEGLHADFMKDFLALKKF